MPGHIAHLARGHCGIKSSLYWVLDVAFRKDERGNRKDNPRDDSGSQSLTTTALRAIEASYRGLRPSQVLMRIGLITWLTLLASEHLRFLPLPEPRFLAAGIQLVAGRVTMMVALGVIGSCAVGELI